MCLCRRRRGGWETGLTGFSVFLNVVLCMMARLMLDGVKSDYVVASNFCGGDGACVLGL
mgnify:CR=1 FL=1